MTSCRCQGVDEIFGERTARHDLRRYPKRGPSKPTRMLLEALQREGIKDATVLDVGGGIGAIQHELLDAGADHATSVEASAAYLRIARDEAERRGHGDRISYQAGVARRHGLAPKLARRAGLVWQVAVYAREPQRPHSARLRMNDSRLHARTALEQVIALSRSGAILSDSKGSGRGSRTAVP
jgi:hypothetical protein